MKKSRVNDFGIDTKWLNKMFPFYLLLDRELNVIEIGDSLKKMGLPLRKSESITNSFSLYYPKIPFEKNIPLEYSNSAITLIYNQNKKVKLRGQFLTSDNSGEILFLCSPILSEIKSLKDISLKVNDFALHDSSINMLFLLQSQQKSIVELEDAQNRIKETQSLVVHGAKMSTLGEMNAAIAHEINNPLVIIKGFADRLTHELEDTRDLDKMKSYSLKISQNTERISNLIRHMKIFSRQEKIELEAIYIDEIIENSFILINQFIKHNGALRETELNCKNIKILGDPSRLELALINFIQNSLDSIKKSKNKEKGKIQINSYIHDENIVIEIVDNGTGVKEGTKNKVFEPFYTTKDRTEGTGLGLSMAKGTIDDHRGKIFFDLTYKGGAKLIIKLPILKEMDIAL